MWEAAATGLRSPSRRLIVIRIGIVLAKKGGYLSETLKAMRTGVIPVFGKGSQYVSWVHPADISGFIAYALQKPSVTGTFNMTAPNPVTGKEMATALKEVTGSAAIIFNIPAMLLRFILGEMATMILEGQRVSSKKMEQAGYSFRFSDIKSALTDLMK